jgi:hypothetical protein
MILRTGILRNISPIPPPSAASAVDVDKDIVLPQLQPVVSALSLPEASASALELISKSQQVRDRRVFAYCIYPHF